MRLEIPIKFPYTNSMKIINNPPRVLTFVQFESEDEGDAVAELLGDLGLDNVVFTKEGFFALTTEVFEIMDALKPYLEDEDGE